ncbi:MAG: hypothetical protein WCJ41_10040 [Aestuariivirga sp.]|uniref:hypothetical protein n=1 Tax=Aestuariivirga sp. TaxID=2650926 RepID=UPI0030167FAB
MTFKSLFTSRNAAVQGGQNDNAGMIVILMMSLVFVPIIFAHAAMVMPEAPGTQLAGMFSALLKTF